MKKRDRVGRAIRHASPGTKRLLDALEWALDHQDKNLLAAWDARVLEWEREERLHWPEGGWPESIGSCHQSVKSMWNWTEDEVRAKNLSEWRGPRCPEKTRGKQDAA